MRKLNESMLPEAPKSFDLAMRSTLRAICEQEAAEKAREAEEIPKRMDTPTRRVHQAPKRRVLIALVAALALIGSVALAAALRYNVFEALLGGVPQGAEEILQHDLASVQIGDVEIAVKEAAYDGVTLYLLTSARDTTATECFGEPLEENGIRYLNHDDAIPEIGGMWTDNFWIDGRNIGMPSGSMMEIAGSDTPGEVLRYYTYRLDHEGENGVFLQGKVRVTLPILERQDSMKWFDRETSVMREPDAGVISFTVDCSASEKTKTTTPNIRSDVGDGIQAWTSRAIFSPLFTYLTVDYQVPQALVDAYIEKNGAGYQDENGEVMLDEEGNVMFPYSAMDIIESWALRLKMVDRDGQIIGETGSDIFVYGNGGVGDTSADYLFPAVKDLGQEIYLAPWDQKTDKADMERAVRVN